MNVLAKKIPVIINSFYFFNFFSICGNGYPCFEISAVNADKPPLSVSEIKDRVKQFENVGMFVFQLYVLCGCKMCSTFYLFWLWDWIYWSHKYNIKISKYPFLALVAFMKSSIMWKIEHHLPIAFSLNIQLLQQQNQTWGIFLSVVVWILWMKMILLVKGLYDRWCFYSLHSLFILCGNSLFYGNFFSLVKSVQYAVFCRIFSFLYFESFGLPFKL